MTHEEMNKKLMVMVEHLNQAMKIATELKSKLDHVDGPAPKRGKRSQVDEMIAKVIARRKLVHQRQNAQ